MAPYTIHPRMNNSSRFIYDLTSVIVHTGTLDSGHYYSYCQQGENVGYNGQRSSRFLMKLILVANKYSFRRYIVVPLQRWQGHKGASIRCSKFQRIPAILHSSHTGLSGVRVCIGHNVPKLEPKHRSLPSIHHLSTISRSLWSIYPLELRGECSFALPLILLAVSMNRNAHV